MNGAQLLNIRFKEVSAVIMGGFAVFAMFFGAGNLVFPLLAGKVTNSAFFPAFAGLSLTGILIPLSGLVGILLYNGNYQDFFDRFGKVTAFVLILIMLLLLGPFGALPRCITVAFGSFTTMYPAFPLSGFSLMISGIVFLLCMNENKVVPLLGALLAPAKILSVGFILLFGLLFANAPQPSLMPSPEAFQEGAFKGYQMMDLIAAFFFATVIARHFKLKFSASQANQGNSFNLTLYAILLGSGLLLIVYFALVYLGATFSEELDKNMPEQFLSVVAYLTLGNLGGRIVTVAIILSCLTTIVALTTVFTDFLYEQIFNKRLSRMICLAVTISGTFLMSNLGFSGIMAFLTPILSYLYPLLILLTVINIASWFWKRQALKSLQSFD
ncbi:MAG TPA: branched-chain amino acid transport system II carrier protein [Alphaproteobacteria bacterium]|nr:branched-chain amino acid transport system II carrier protein [Alphaproteobacteria bacterium]